MEVATILLDKGVPIDCRMKDRSANHRKSAVVRSKTGHWTGLMLCAACGHADMIDMLLKRGAQINACSVSGAGNDQIINTALSLATNRRQSDAVQRLLEHKGVVVQGAMKWARDDAMRELIYKYGGRSGDQKELIQVNPNHRSRSLWMIKKAHPHLPTKLVCMYWWRLQWCQRTRTCEQLH